MCLFVSNYTIYSHFVSDIDECDKDYKGGCSQKCTNKPGSFVCSCEKGYNLDTDGKTCIGESNTTPFFYLRTKEKKRRMAVYSIFSFLPHFISTIINYIVIVVY